MCATVLTPRSTMALVNEFFGEVGNHPLGASIEAGRHTFHQRRDLRDPHTNLFHDS